MVAIIAATGTFLIAFDSGSFQLAQAGLSYQGRPDAAGARPRFLSLRFRNPTASPITVSVQVSTGDIFDNRAIFGAGNVPVTIVDTYLPREAVPSLIASVSSLFVPASSSVTIAVANAGRKAMCVQHMGTETMYLKTGGGLNDQGIPLFAGERLEVENNGELKAFNLSGFPQKLLRWEVLW
ncbi:MAG: hypothetical protein WCY02_01725 [Parvibaculum sp.]